MDYIYQLNDVLTSMKGERSRLLSALDRLPKENLYYQKSNGVKTFHYKHEPNGTINNSLKNNSLQNHSNSERYLSKCPELLDQLLCKEFYTTQISVIDSNISALSKLISSQTSNSFDSVVKRLPARCRRIPVNYFDKAVNKPFGYPNPSRDTSIQVRLLGAPFDGVSPEVWGVTPYRENTSHLENKIHRGSNELLFRSKSEMIIAGFYENNCIPYHYDEVFRFAGELISPDFVIINYRGEFVYHEHLGMTDNLEYLQSSLSKLSIYANAGIVLGKNLILTFDNPDGSMDFKLVKDTISQHLKGKAN